jgi:hypothetical protein
VEIQGTPPKDITGNLKQALMRSNWIGETDFAAVALAERLAVALDTCFDTGELRDVPALAQRFIGVLQQLHLTVETRTQGNKEEEDNGEQHRGNYLRLLEATTSKPKPKAAKRG